MWSDPEVFGGFLLVRRIAESWMANVDLAVRLGDASGRTLVVKRPPLGERPSGRPAQALLREAEVLSEVRGPGIPRLEAAGEIAGLPYVGLERVRGATLERLVAMNGALPIPAVRAIGKDVARALSALHAAGWVHRDVTPSNLLVDDAGEVYLLDFGLCERAGIESASLLAGTRGYAAPEAPTARAAAAAQDVYGLAVCLAEAALGRRLFDEASLVEAAGRGDAPPAAASLESDLPGIAAALRRDPAARPSAEKLAEGLGASGDRDALAAMAERASAASQGAPEPPARAPAAVVTPTVSMPPVVPRDPAAPEAVKARRAGVVQTLPDIAPLPLPSAAPPASAPAGGSSIVRPAGAPSSAGLAGRAGLAGPRRFGVVALIVAAVVALVIGFLVGRFTHRLGRSVLPRSGVTSGAE